MQLGQLTPTGQKDFLCFIMSCSAIKTQVEEEGDAGAWLPMQPFFKVRLGIGLLV